MLTALVLGAGGFVGTHMVKRLIAEGYDVIGADLKRPEFSPSAATLFRLVDLRESYSVHALMRAYRPDEIYQLACDMGGAGYIFSGEHDADVLHNNALINLNVLRAAVEHKVPRIFFSSSACVYPTSLQTVTDGPSLKEDDVLPALPDHDYGWEKLFSEQLYQAYRRNYNLQVHIARFASIVGPEGTWQGERAKVFAALARKVALAEDGGAVEMWGDGEQTRTFLHVEDCVDGIRKIMASAHPGPFNLGSEEVISMNALAQLFADIAGKQIEIIHIDGPLGVRGRQIDCSALQQATGWQRVRGLEETAAQTYTWIEQQVKEAQRAGTL